MEITKQSPGSLKNGCDTIALYVLHRKNVFSLGPLGRLNALASFPYRPQGFTLDARTLARSLR